MIAFARALPGLFVLFAGGRAMARGVVKWFDPKKGYGFIMQEGAPDVFVHWRNIESSDDFKTLRKGLGYCWSVAVAALPEEGRPMMERWLACDDKDVIWIMKQNLRKKRLARVDAAWVETWKRRLGI